MRSFAVRYLIGPNFFFFRKMGKQHEGKGEHGALSQHMDWVPLRSTWQPGDPSYSPSRREADHVRPAVVEEGQEDLASVG